MDIVLLINIFGLLILLTSVIDFKLSLALYLAFIVLVPFVHIDIGGFIIYENRLLPIMFLAFLLYRSRQSNKRLDLTTAIPFISLYIFIFFISLLLTSEVPFNFQVDLLANSAIAVVIISLLVWNQINSESKTIIYLKRALIVAIIISGVYGIVLSQLDGENNYTSVLSKLYHLEDSADFFSTNVESSRLAFTSAAKIQSTAIHPMTWSLLLCFFLVFTVIQILKTKSLFYWLMLALVLTNLLISGVRTGIIASAVAALYLILRYKKGKLILIGVGAFAVLLIAVRMNADLNNLFSSFIDISGKKSNVSGSSIQMRLDQLSGALDVVKGHELFGRGYGWAQHYMSLYKIHPILLAFESLFFLVICNSGIIGFIIWTTFFIALFKIPRRILSSQSNIFIIDTFIIQFIAYTLITGEYGYMKFFAFFFSFLLGLLLSYEKAPSAEEILIRNKNFSSHIFPEKYNYG